MLYKNIDTKIITRNASTGEKDLVTFVASTSNPDRYGDIINQKGWQLEKYRKNPVILLNHNASQLPIGRGEVEIVDGQLLVDIEFDMDDPVAANVARKTKNGFMSAVSVGFNAVESISRSDLPSDNPYYAKSGYFFDKAELLEISIVTIPANGEAVAAKNYTSQNRQFKISELKHIVDIEIDGDHIVVTYLYKREKVEEEEEKTIDEEEPKEKEMDHDDESEEHDEKYHGDHDDNDKEKNFLTNQERDLFALITTNGE